MGIHKRKILRKKERKHTFDQEKSQDSRKQERKQDLYQEKEERKQEDLDQEKKESNQDLDQEKEKVLRSYLFSFRNSHLRYGSQYFLPSIFLTLSSCKFYVERVKMNMVGDNVNFYFLVHIQSW